MSAAVTVEQQRLRAAASVVHNFTKRFPRKVEEAKFQLLEAAAARLGSHDVVKYQAAFGRSLITSINDLDAAAIMLLEAIRQSGIEPALALSALSREGLTKSEQRSTGAYHTDFRLAMRLARTVGEGLDLTNKVVDPACGSGILLVALTLKVCGHDRKSTAQWLRDSVCAVDLSETALRGATLALAALTDDLTAVMTMRRRWIVGDSLTIDASVWNDMAPGGFDAIVANPPWEKVRLTRHEFLQKAGAASHYGADVAELDRVAFEAKSTEVRSYADLLVSRFPMLLRGEPDLYTAFMALYLNLLRPGGKASMLVPGGLIRSQGTTALRETLLERAHRLEIGVLDNRARFFNIDTRFKFVAVDMVQHLNGLARDPVVLAHERGTDTGVDVVSRVRIGRKALRASRSDLSIPEVASPAAWSLFQRLTEQGERLDDRSSNWYADFCREVDMTLQRHMFKRSFTSCSVPVIEGRHIQQHRLGAKAYVGGSGRAAVWETRPLGGAQVLPQFFIEPNDCPQKAVTRIGTRRVGFCDIAGQTNERSMMASIIEPGMVCGNKVPTALFPNDPSEDRLFVWLAVVNSLTFDWMLRRILTTTINLFLLVSLPMPRIKPNGLPWRRLATAARELHELNMRRRASGTDERSATLRLTIEVEVARAYGVTLDDLVLMSSDFPLLDRGQPTIAGENRSTVTWDSILAAFAGSKSSWHRRAAEARERGAIPFIPAQHGTTELGGEGTYGAEGAG
jgi:methylase of polypeptide subunit release factors